MEVKKYLKHSYKGVHYWHLGNNYVVKVPYNSVTVQVGYYETAHEAAVAYNAGLEILQSLSEPNRIHPSDMPKKDKQALIKAAVALALDRIVNPVAEGMLMVSEDAGDEPETLE